MINLRYVFQIAINAGEYTESGEFAQEGKLNGKAAEYESKAEIDVLRDRFLRVQDELVDAERSRNEFAAELEISRSRMAELECENKQLSRQVEQLGDNNALVRALFYAVLDKVFEELGYR